MEHINRIELLGVVGSTRLHKMEGGMLSVLRMSLATQYAYRDKSGTAVVDITWHDVTAWSGKKIDAETLAQIQKGDTVRVTGRLRTQKYCAETGETRYACDVLASELEKI